MCVKKPKSPSPLQLKSPKKNTVKKRTRCPKGTRKNPKTGKCEQSGVKAPSLKAPTKAPTSKPKAPSPIPKAPTTSSKSPNLPLIQLFAAPSKQAKNKNTVKKRTRCPKGTRKNPKTGKCESVATKTLAKTKSATKKKEQPIVIPSSTPADIKELSDEVAKHISQKKPISPEKMTALIKSFSPSIHARLEQFNSSPLKGKKLTKEKLPLETQRNRMLDCLDEHALISKYRLSDNKREQERRQRLERAFLEGGSAAPLQNYDYTYLYNKQMPKIYVDGVCYPGKNLKSQKLLLKSLNESIKNVDISKLVTPKQYASNCWFNSFFVVFFIGDKGRKFSKALRHLMITQRGPGEKSMIDSLKMRKTMFAFNLAIEASLTGNPVAYKINTNSFVVSLADSMPKEHRKNMPKYNQASNPIFFYEKLMYYYEKVHNVKGISTARFAIEKKEQDLNYPITYKLIVESKSDLVIVEVHDQGINDHNKSKYQTKPLKISYDSKEYTLGAVVIRDTKRRHFCCVCDVNGKEYGFDGASFKRLNRFRWRKLLNKDKKWTFEGSNWTGTGKDVGQPILWNFMNGYQMLFYYRTK